MLEAYENRLPGEKISLMVSFPFISVHIGALAALFIMPTNFALIMMVAIYFIRMFAITAGFHRYFSHRSFKTSRIFQFILAYLATCSAQMGPIWWASHHRHHHKYTDKIEDPHPPNLKGFVWAHVGWIMSPANVPTKTEYVKDLMRYPELRYLDKYHYAAPLSLVILLYSLGEYMKINYVSYGTNGIELVVWGFFVSTVLLYHATFMVNSVCHVFGYRSYDTKDGSVNNLLVAILTLGEGWHNNHHAFPNSERQGHQWYQIDISHYILWFLSLLGIVWKIRQVPEDSIKERIYGA
jgi:stearoyl-CoA desaturase (delta-9 desaturase)|tara:strand:- start:639 stop:1523 length:885 start_codon:yes stop_codon:yes gene_type:complete